MLEYMVNYFDNKPDAKKESRRLEDCLEKLGVAQHLGGSPGGNMTQFSLKTEHDEAQVRRVLTRLQLQGSWTLNQREEENA